MRCDGRSSYLMLFVVFAAAMMSPTAASASDSASLDNGHCRRQARPFGSAKSANRVLAAKILSGLSGIPETNVLACTVKNSVNIQHPHRRRPAISWSFSTSARFSPALKRTSAAEFSSQKQHFCTLTIFMFGILAGLAQAVCWCLSQRRKANLQDALRIVSRVVFLHTMSPRMRFQDVWGDQYGSLTASV